jgi:KDO2-lipid IV(A) lauroyltransferase
MRVLYGISGLLYVLIFHVFSYRKRVVIQNLSRSFPEKRYDEIAAITRDFYRSFCYSLVEILKSASIPARLQQEKVELVGREVIESYLKQGRPVIASMGHCGNWELLNVLPVMLSANVNTVYKPLSTRCVDRLFLKIRSRFGMNMIPRQVVARHLVANKENPSVYLFLADQCPRGEKGVIRCDFLHQETRVFPGIERLARATGAVVVYLHVTRISRGKYRVECKDLCLDPARAVETGITDAYTRLLEENIREDPGGWLWSHKRWKR